jgi:hypothetical protein
MTSPINHDIHAMSPVPASLAHLGIGPYPLAGKAPGILEGPPPDGWRASGLDRDVYLDLAEAIVRTARPWQDENGAIIDPVDGIEFNQTTPRYASSAAILLAFGRIPDLAASVYRAMDWACRRLVTGQAGSPDFWMRELATAYLCLAPIADAADLRRWRDDLSAVVPEAIYRKVRPDGQGLDALHNWTVYAAAGEILRGVAGLAPDDADVLWGEGFFHKYMPAQIGHFTAYGMYRDPHDPITYDITTRLQITAALALGYDGPLRDALSELLRRGGLTLLHFVSPLGQAPFGGRSSQFNFQEMILSVLCEAEACRYKGTDARLAGAFKRQAHRSAQAVRRWILERDPFQFVKNGFSPTAAYGLERYAKYSCYGLLAASFAGLAALLADDEIAEAPCPSEIGGYALILPDAFHKVFATCQGTHLEIDTGADFHYDGTGLGRFHRVGVPSELGPSTPITATPAYSLPEENLPEHNLAVGPAWPIEAGWQRLADLAEGLAAETEVDAETPDRVALTVRYRHLATGAEISEAYTLTQGTLDIRTRVTREGAPVDRIRFLVPLLATDGTVQAALKQTPGQIRLTYRDATLTVDVDRDYEVQVSEALVGNRNGLYRPLILEAPGGEIAVRLSLDSGGERPEGRRLA